MIKSSQKEILLGVNLDSELKFEGRVNFVCKKASQKLYNLAPITPFMHLKQRRNIMKVFVESQFVVVLLYGCSTTEDLIAK